MKSVFSSQILFHSLRWIFKLGLLNAINLGLACLLVLARLAFEQIPLSDFQFPFYLFLTGLVLMNWVYNLGLVYEWIYHRLWSLELDFKKVETQFFKAGVLMVFIVDVFGLYYYLIWYKA